MTDEMRKYYASIDTAVSGAEMRSLPMSRYEVIKKWAEDDVRADSKTRDPKEFQSDVEFRIYLLLVVDYSKAV